MHTRVAMLCVCASTLCSCHCSHVGGANSVAGCNSSLGTGVCEQPSASALTLALQCKRPEAWQRAPACPRASFPCARACACAAVTSHPVRAYAARLGGQRDLQQKVRAECQ